MLGDLRYKKQKSYLEAVWNSFVVSIPIKLQRFEQAHNNKSPLIIGINKNQNLFGEMHDHFMNEEHRAHNKGSHDKSLLNF